MTTKIHMLVDAMGHPLRFVLTGGQINDCTQAEILLENVGAQAILADKGYDTDKILAQVNQSGAKAVIPSKSNRKIQREYDRELYKQRNWIERAFNRLKYYRRIATRYDRKTLHYASFLYLAAALCWG